jgi:hypothetical protein
MVLWIYLANDDNSSVGCDKLTTGDCSVVWYDFCNQSIFPNNNPNHQQFIV